MRIAGRGAHTLGGLMVMKSWLVLGAEEEFMSNTRSKKTLAVIAGLALFGLWGCGMSGGPRGEVASERDVAASGGVVTSGGGGQRPADGRGLGRQPELPPLRALHRD